MRLSVMKILNMKILDIKNKTILLTTLVQLAFQLATSQSFAMTCFQPSSGELLSIHRDNTKLHLSYSNNHGYNSIRQFEGPVAATDIPLIQFQNENLKNLGAEFEFTLPVENCDFSKTSPGVALCSGDSPVAGTSLMVSSLSAYTVTQQHLSGNFKLQNFRMMIGQENVFFFVFSFPAQNCTGDL